MNRLTLSFVFFTIGVLALTLNLRGALVYKANFESYPANAAITLDTTGSNDTFSSAPNIVATAQDHTSLAFAEFSLLEEAFATGDRSLVVTNASASQNLNQGRVFSSNPPVMVVSLLWLVPDANAATLSVNVVNSAGQRQHAALPQITPGTAGTLSRFTMVMNNSGSDLLLPGDNVLPSGFVANYRTMASGAIVSYNAVELFASTGNNFTGFSIRQGNGALTGYYDNVMVWDSVEDALGEYNVLELPVRPPLPAEPIELFAWDMAAEIHPGIRHVRLTLTEPRQLSVNALRVDLSNPDVRLFTTGRAANWSENNFETLKQTTRNFVASSRSTKRKMVVAVNGAAWQPWPPPFPDSGRADLNFLAISNGVLVSPVAGNRPTLVVNKDWSMNIVSLNADSDLSNILHAVATWGYCLRNNVPEGATTSFEPRTGIGISADRRWLVLLAIDGRQPGHSEGVSIFEVGHFLRYFGATTGMNMDGGGSTTMVKWNASANRADLLNIPSERFLGSVVEREVGNNVGIYYVEDPEPIGFTDWLRARSVPADVRGPWDDPNRDGINNLLAYKLNIHPLRPRASDDAGALPAPDINPGEPNGAAWEFTYRLNRHATEATATPEFSSDLLTWIAVPNLNVQQIGRDPVTGDPVFRATIEANGQNRGFFRLRVNSLSAPLP